MSNLVLTSLSSSNRIRRELAYGEAYRHTKSKAFGQPIYPVCSPLDVTYFVHRKRRVEKVVEEIESKDTASQRQLKRRARCKSKSVPHIKNSFWERAKLTHKQYIDVLSTPHLQSCGDADNVKKLKSKTTSTLCSPRLIQMSCPNKRRLLATWQYFGDQLPAETLQRFHDMLHTDKNIDLKDARNYFKMRDRKRKRLQRRRKLKRKKRKNQHKASWLKEQIEETSSAIMNFFSGNPKLEMSYKQLLISDTLMVLLSNVLGENKPMLRYSSDLYNKQLVKMVDKIALWIDSVSKIVEIQSLEEEEEEEAPKLPETKSSTISTITVSELSAKEAEKGEEEEGEEGEEAEEGEREEEEGETEGEEEEEEGEEYERGKGEGKEYERGKGEGKEGVMSITSLEKLIKILAHASPSYLGGTLEDLENLTRNELLNKIKILNKDYKEAETPAELLKKIITEWALHNQPNEVDKRVRKKIEEVAGLLAAMLAAEDLYGMMDTLPITDEGDEHRPAKKEPGAKRSTVRSAHIATIDFGEDDVPIPGTVTEILSPSGSVHLGVVDDDGNVNPVTMTPSGNLIPTVYDKDGKVVDKLYDKVGDQLDSTFNQFGVPEPDNYDGPLYDDENKAHELIYNEKGHIIPQCYDKDGNPIAAAYDEDGNPIYFGPDGKPISVPPGGSAKIIGGKLVILNADGEEIEEGEEAGEETEEEGEKPEDDEEEMEPGEGMEGDETEPPKMKDTEGEGEELKVEEEEEEEEGTASEEEEGGEEEEEGGEEVEEEEEESSTSEEEEEEKPAAPAEKEEPSTAGSRESMITVIRGHKPKKVYEHSNDTVCCLSLKIWAVWLLEITHNAHNWTKWVTNIIGQIREFAAILRGEVILPNGQKKVLFKDDWNKFVADMNEDVIAWRQYCRHVNDLTNKIVEKFHGKKVHCCEKCLQDHLIKNVVTAHDTMRALTEALNCAGYWQRCLDEIVEATTKLTEIRPEIEGSSSDEETGWSYSSSSSDDKDDYYCYTKRRKLTPSPTWKKLKESPCACPCKLKQLFPKET